MTAGWKRGLLVLLSVALVVVAAGFIMPLFSRPSPAGRMTNGLIRLKQVGTGLRLYAIRNEGRFPATLNELVPTYCPDAQILAMNLPMRGVEPQWQYHSGHKDDGNQLTVLANSPLPYGDQWLVLFGDFSVKVVVDADFWKLGIKPP